MKDRKKECTQQMGEFSGDDLRKAPPQKNRQFTECDQSFHSFVENSNDGIILTDQTGRIIEWNRGMERISGICSEEALGSFSWEVMFRLAPVEKKNKAAYEHLKNATLKYLAKGSAPWSGRFIETEIELSDGTRRYIQDQTFPIKASGGFMCSSIIRDITGQKQIEEEIRRHRDNLEELVRERTERLRAANEKLGQEIKKRSMIEEALWESHGRYETFLRALPVGLFQTDISGRCVYANHQASVILDLSPEEIAGYKWTQALHPEDRDEVIAECRLSLERQKIFRMEYRILRRDGNTVWVLGEAIPYTGYGKDLLGFVGTLSDITDLKNAEEDLKRSEERYRRLVEMSPLAIAVHNMGEITFINKVGADLLGAKSPEEISGKKVMDFVLPEYHQIVSGRINELLAKKNPVPLIEEKFLRLDGKLIDVEVAAAPLNLKGGPAIQVVFRDITERKKAEEALRDSERFLVNIFESIHDRLSIIDTGFNIIRVNRKVEQEYRHALPLDGKKCHHVYQGRDEICDGCPGVITLRTGETAHAVLPMRDRDGNITGWLDHHCYPFVDKETGSLNGIIIYARDITERYRLEQEMARLERLNLVGEMAASIGHEVRNPMTTVRGFLQMLGGKEECSVYKDYYDLMIDELDRANSIITEFLSLARNKPVDLEKQNLNAIVRTISPLFSASAANAKEEVRVIPGDLPDLLLNEKEIRQLLLNLVRNGLEAMGPGGKLTVKTYMDNDCAVLSVQDQGKGISPELAHKVGTPFFTTKEMGTGLGLAVCYSIASRHGASIEFETGSGGTTFFVRFRLPQGK